MEKTSILKVDLTGKTSCRKTHTASSLAQSLSKHGYETVWLSRGDYYRLASEILHDWEYPPENVNEQVIKSLSERMKVKLIEGRRLVPYDTESGNHTTQTFHNGSLAANYSQNPLLQEFIANLENTGLEEYSPNASILINEGRLPDGEVHIRLDGTKTARQKIRRQENSLPDGTTDETILTEFDTRDRKDAPLLSLLPDRSVFNINLFDWTPEIDDHLVSYLEPLIIARREGNIPKDFEPIGVTFGSIGGSADTSIRR